MKRLLVGSALILPLAACEPTVDPGDQSATRFSEPGPVADEQDRIDLEQPADEPAWNGDPVGEPEDPFEDPYGEDVAPLVMREGSLRGSVGPVLDIASDATELHGSSMDGWLNVQTTVRQDPRIAMTIVDFAGDLSALEVGRTYRYAADGMAEGAPSAPWLMVVGCASADNPDEGFDFDQPADEVDVTIEEPEADVVEVSYEARFTQYDDYGAAIGETTVQGRFVYER